MTTSFLCTDGRIYTHVERSVGSYKIAFLFCFNSCLASCGDVNKTDIGMIGYIYCPSPLRYIFLNINVNNAYVYYNEFAIPLD